MPRTKLGEKVKAWKRDEIKDLVISAQSALELSNDEFAEMIGVSRNTWIRRKSVSSAEWTLGEIRNALKVSGYEIEINLKKIGGST